MKRSYQIIFWIFILVNGLYSQSSKKVEIYFDSKEVLDKGLLVDSFYRFGIETIYCDSVFLKPRGADSKPNDSFIVVNFKASFKNLVLKLTNKKTLAFPWNSVWGYRTFNADGSVSPISRMRGGGGDIVQNGELIIYKIVGTKGTIFYYFSKNLDSKVFLLDRFFLKRAFKDNPKFFELVKKETNWYAGKKSPKNLWAHDSTGTKFKIVELYKKSLEP